MNMDNTTLVFKWLKSCNGSSPETKALGNKTRQAFGLTARQYRKMLSWGREKTRVLETLMSENRWDEINFSHIPSKAGLQYSNAFKTREETKDRYEEFINSKENRVNAGVLYPYEVVNKAIHTDINDEAERNIANKYWDNLPDYFNGASSNMLCVVDTSGSMDQGGAASPINMAISLSMYCAERLNGPFHNRYISFSSKPQLIKIEGTDFVDKVKRIYNTNLCENTDLEAVFDMLLTTIIKNHVKPKDIPTSIIVISDMQVDEATQDWNWYNRRSSHKAAWTAESTQTEMEKIRSKWAAAGLRLPKLVYWDVDSREDTILDSGPNVSYVSGASPVIFQSVLTGKTGYDLMLDKLQSDRYRAITA